MAIALLAMGIHFAPVQAAVASDRASVSSAFDSAHRTMVVAPAKTSPGELGLAKQDCPPICPTGCSHALTADCCGSSVLAVGSVPTALISATVALLREADQSLSGVEPDTLQEPPQFFA